MNLILNECAQARKSFSGYLDGTISGKVMQSVLGHLENCESCAGEFASWRAMQQILATVGPVQAPANMGLRLRLAISHEAMKRQDRHNSISVRWANFLRPVLLQVASGLAGALLLFGGFSALVGVVPQAVLANDEPLGAATVPHYLYSAVQQQSIVAPDDMTIVVEADINSKGRVYQWKIVSGPQDEKTLGSVNNELMLQVYDPARIFGEPVRGHVLVTFSGVIVHG